MAVKRKLFFSYAFQSSLKYREKLSVLKMSTSISLWIAAFNFATALGMKLKETTKKTFSVFFLFLICYAVNSKLGVRVEEIPICIAYDRAKNA